MLGQDLKQALRGFQQSPGFVLTAIATLALGIGANTAVFSVVNAVLLKPVPYPYPDRLVMFMSIFGQGPSPVASPAKFEHYREQTSVTEDVSAFRNGVVNYTGGAFPEQLRLAQVSVDYFRLFGAPIIVGRSFLPEEDLPRGPHVALIGEGLWRRRFDGDRGVIGKAISLSGAPYVVIGIVSTSFDTREFGPPPEVWIPFQFDPNTTDQGHYFLTAGRLKPGVTLPQAQAKLKLSAQDFRRKFPALPPTTGFTVTPLQDTFVGNARPTLLVLASAVGLVLLIACANVANLLLVRATGRRREIAIRAAIGAERARIIQQLLTESVALSVVGGVVGLALGLIGIRALLAVNTAGLPRLGEKGTLVGADWRVLVFTLLISAGTGILFGLVPAIQASRGDLTTSLKEGGGRTGTGFRHNKTRSLLVITELALALMLLVGSALLIRTSIALAAVNPGFDPNNILTMRMSLTGPHFQKADAVAQLVREGTDHLRALPGVEAVSATCCVPLGGFGYGLPFNILGRAPAANSPFLGDAGWMNVSPGYFEVFQIPVKRGRVFNENDDKASRPVVVINEAMAKQFWKDSDPLRDQLLIGKGLMRELADEPARQIIGIVADSHDNGLSHDPAPKMFIPQAQIPDALNALNNNLTPITWVVRTKVQPYSLSRAIQEQLRQVSGLPVSDVRTMNEVVALSVSRQRFNMLLMSIFGGSALLLAVVGIYGLMAHSVQQLTQEIGIRMALGARAGAVRNMVLIQGMLLVLTGLAIGIGAAFALTRFLASLLFGVKAVDPMIFALIPILLSLVALISIWLPALRASQLDPMAALRHE